MVDKKESYEIRRSHDLREVPGGHEVHYMVYHITGPDLNNFLSVPCRAKLHHSLTGLFYNWDWKDESTKEITEEEAFALKHVFTSQTEYKLWKQTLEKINELGQEEAKKWFIDQIKVLTLRNVLRNK